MLVMVRPAANHSVGLVVAPHSTAQHIAHLVDFLTDVHNGVGYVAGQASIVLMRQVEGGQVEGVAIADAGGQVLCDLDQHTLPVPLICHLISFTPVIQRDTHEMYPLTNQNPSALSCR